MLQFLKSLFKSPSHSAGYTHPIVSSQNTSTDFVPQYQNDAYRKHWDKIQFAFLSGDKPFFCFSHDINIPYERMHAAIDIYREYEAAVNPKFLDSHIAAVEAILLNERMKPLQKMQEIGILNLRLKERKELAISIQLPIKLATVKYFDETENPFDYQHDYNHRKIQHWMKYADVPAFFLSLPENQLMTSTQELQRNLKTYLQGETLMNLKMLQHHITSIASTNSESDILKILHLQKELEETFLDWSNQVTTNTT